jgi:hypothetical protein
METAMPATIQEEIWEILHGLSQTTKELAQSSQETERRFQETDRRFQETERRFQETDRKFQETERLFKETECRFKDIESRFKDIEHRFQETDQKFRETNALFIGQWGKLVEALMRPGLQELFRQRGFPISEVLQRDRVRRDGREIEIDVMLENGDIVIPVEVKTTLKVQDVRDYLKRMEEFLAFFPKYQGYRVHGAVAGVQIEESADRYAYRQGLFVLALGRDGLCVLLNDENFVPKNLALNASHPHLEP